MPIDYDALMAWPIPDRLHTYRPDDAILYALGIGMGGRPEDLPFVYEKALRVMPTMAVVLAHPGFWMRDPATGITWKKLLHLDQSVTMARPLPSAATIAGRTWVTGLVDRGESRGALLSVARELREADSGEVVCRMDATYLLRGDGGFGGPAGRASTPTNIPSRQADALRSFHISSRAALIYRLSGDKNPLHIDPDVAAAAGFSTPILHGLCTFGGAAREIVAVFCENDPERLVSIKCGFTAPVYPGETIRMEMWQEPDRIAFRAHSVDRSVIVLDHGRAVVG